MKKYLLLFFVTILLIANSTSISAQIEDPVTWGFKAKKIEGKKYEIVINASIEQGWHLYSTSLPEGGPIATTFTFKQSPDFKLVGKVKEISIPIKEHDEIFNLDLSFFSKEATFSQVVELIDIETTNVEGNIEYQACFSDKCIYLEKDFSVKLTGNESQKLEGQQQKASEKNESSSLWYIFFYALGWGLLGLLTPCVYPMIPMTVSFFLNNESSRLKSIINALVFGLSIIAIYTSIGLLVSLFGLSPNFATVLTSHWIPNIIFFLLFIAFAASFFGLFEITLPSSLTTKTDSKVEKGGFIGSFFMALTLILVSLSCVGPILGNVLIEASRGLGLRPIIGMLGFSIAFALPFTIFAIFPSLLKGLPKSGGWLNSVKVVLAFFMLAFSLKFLMIIDDTYHFGLLGRDVYIAIWISIFSLMGFYLLGKIKFKHDSELKHVGVFRLLLATASFAFVVYLIPGMIGAPLKSISGLLPPQASHSFDLMTMISKSKPVPSVKVDDRSPLCEAPKYADILHLPYGLEGYFNYNQALACARTQKKPLFIDFVGHSCSNCKEMESKVWSDPRVLEKLRNDYIIVALYIDERLELPESEWYTAKDGKTKKTIGKQNADMQISRFNINGQPYYVLLDGNEKTLAEPRGYNLDVDAYIKFLDNGIEEYKKRRNTLQ
ncbi:MAG: thioredoxin family protein [Bacteroidales bacterium]|nr:thioredoxin family protein [Bacteroidales bacterium]